jgi:hypothetical protein
MSIRRLLLRTAAICTGLVVIPVLAAVPLFMPAQYDLPTVQAAQKAKDKCVKQSLPRNHQVATAGPDIVCFYEGITAESSKSFLALPIKDGSILVLRSFGGDAASALDMADVILAKHLVAVVDTVCVSACANYLFTAASVKIVLDGATVGFHGAPNSNTGLKYNGPPEYRALAMAQFQSYFKKLLDRQASFYARIGVNFALVSDNPLRVHRAEFDRRGGFWEYGPDTLRDKFGVRNIIYFQTPNQADLLTGFRSYLTGYNCTLDRPDVYFCAN